MKQFRVNRKMILWILLLLPLFLPLRADAAWKTKDGRSYYTSGGKRVTGLREIGGKYYYFDTQGIQRTSWRQVGNHYSFFNVGDREKGEMLVSATINGIPIDREGKAVVTAGNQRKLRLLLRASVLTDSFFLPGMDMKTRLRKCFDFCVNTFHYGGIPNGSWYTGWELSYAETMFFRGRGNCFAFGAAFAFLANAVGGKNVYAISSTGHGWAEVDGLVYDPDWSLVDKRNDYCGLSYDLSGVNGRPRYKGNRAYAARI